MQKRDVKQGKVVESCSPDWVGVKTKGHSIKRGGQREEAGHREGVTYEVGMGYSNKVGTKRAQFSQG